MSKCHKCSNELSEMDFGRQDTCSKCGLSTRCCLNCKHFDRSKYNECTEPVADRVVDKEKGNFCDYFKPGTPNGGSAANSRDALKAAAEALFKKN